MKVLILEDSALAIARVADMVADLVGQKPDAVLGLATGGTMVPVYERLVSLHQENGLSLAGVTSFNLDEYVGLSAEHPCSYHRYMREVLFDRIDIDLTRTHLPRGDCSDPAFEADRYETAIGAAGGIDLQLLGIGRNGHIGFNEPTSSLTSRTRIKTLSDGTRRANQRYFDSFDDTPRYALTMGVATILDSKFCLLLATGSAKADAVAAMIEGPVAAVCPASALQMHRNATVVLDQDAAAKLKLIDYYQHVHPGGKDGAF